MVRHTVEKAFLVIFERYTVFHHGLFYTLTLLAPVTYTSLIVTVTVAKLPFTSAFVLLYLEGIQLGPKSDELCSAPASGLVLHHSEALFVRTSYGMPFRTVTGVEPFGYVLGDVLVKVLRLDSVTEGVRVRE